MDFPEQLSVVQGHGQCELKWDRVVVCYLQNPS